MADDFDQAGQGFNLVMQLEDRTKLPELMEKLGAKGTRDQLEGALGSLGYVHYSRFLPLWEHGLLLIVTEFDGDMRDYVLDFAAVLDKEFTLILSYMKDRPPLPVSRHPNEFWAYVERNTRPRAPAPPYSKPFSVYKDKSVLEIMGAKWSRSLPAPLPRSRATVDLTDVQANVLFGYRSPQAVHVGCRFSKAEDGRAFINALLSSAPLRVTPQAPRPNKELYCLNIGFTHAGLQALGVPPDVLRRFPEAYREGPRLRAKTLGDEGESAPDRWRIGGVDSHGIPADVHAVVSLHASNAEMSNNLAGLLELSKVYRVMPVFEQHAALLDDKGTVHFGYRDGLSQPRIDGVHEPLPSSKQPLSAVGDFLLGSDYLNSRGGRYIAELPPELAQNATYAAFRVIEQHVKEFESLLDDVHDEDNKKIDRQLVAAKLMGRWRNGSPLVKHPNAPLPNADELSSAELDDFDYVTPSGDVDEKLCPVGAHIRRLNPRGGPAVGIPWGRRVIRRGMPYGPLFRPGDGDDAAERGLVGMFLCADLESQFEFLQRVWANKDLSAFGLRGTKDPFAGTRDGKTPFRFSPDETSKEIEIEVPPLTRTAGSLYLLMPGIGGLRWIAEERWTAKSSREKTARPHVPSRPGVDLSRFDPSDPEFRADPYRFYAAMRAEAPVKKISSHGKYWVLSHALVTDVCDRKDVFLKPGKNRDKLERPANVPAQFGDGLFFMDPLRHTQVRDIMEDVLGKAIAGVDDVARRCADKLLDEGVRDGKLELAADYASKLPTQVFMQIMGIPPKGDADLVDRWNRAALDSHDVNASRLAKGQGFTAMMALYAYFRALASECPLKLTDAGAPTVIAGMRARTADVQSASMMDHCEAMNTSIHFTLGGYLSTEFLLITGVHNLLRHPDQWNKLREDRTLLEGAVREMLRYDAPFQMADRHVAEGCMLHDTKLEPGDQVTVVYGSANRDEAIHKDNPPDRFDIERKPTVPHYGFGHGIHECIGAELALRVAKIGISTLLDRCPSARLGEVGQWLPDPYFRSLSKVALLLR